jgi:hypothetical protein
MENDGSETQHVQPGPETVISALDSALMDATRVGVQLRAQMLEMDQAHKAEVQILEEKIAALEAGK